MGVLSPVLNGTGSVAIKSLATKHAVKAGMGAGEYAGQYANLRALVYCFGPFYTTWLYQYLAQRGLPTYLTYYSLSLLGFVLPGLLHLSWRSEDMFPEGM